METEPIGWDKPIKPDRWFFLSIAIVAPVTLYFCYPWLSNSSTIGAIAGCLVIPFLASVFVYASLRVGYLVLVKHEISKRQIHAFLLTLLFLVTAFILFQIFQKYSPINYFAIGFIPGGIGVGIYYFCSRKNN